MSAYRSYYLVDKIPIYLTFEKYADILNVLEKQNIYVGQDSCQLEMGMNSKLERKVIFEIRKQLKWYKDNDPWVFNHEYMNMKLRGEDAQKCVSWFLTAISDYYGLFRIEGRSSFDLNFTFGKTFSLKTNCKKTSRWDFVISTDDVEEIYGNVLNAVIRMKSNILVFESGTLSIISASSVDDDTYQDMIRRQLVKNMQLVPNSILEP